MRNQSMFGCGGTLKRLNMFRKLIFGFLILTVVLTSGCINSYEQSQKTQSTEVINLDAQQLILNEIEVKEVLGDEWKNVNTHSVEKPTSSSGIGMIYDNSSDTERYTSWRATSGEMIFQPVDISLYVYTDIAEAKEAYLNEISNKDYKGNKINIGDDGNIYTIDSFIKVIFRKNNVISIIYLSSNKSELLNVDMAVKLAKKQEAKISNIFEMIK